MKRKTLAWLVMHVGVAVQVRNWSQRSAWLGAQLVHGHVLVAETVLQKWTPAICFCTDVRLLTFCYLILFGGSY